MSAPKSAAGLYMSDVELADIASTGLRPGDASRATMAEFARTFAGLALLPPNEEAATELPAGWPDARFTPPSTADSTLMLSDSPSRLAAVVSGWVSRSIAAHSAADPDLVRLTNAPLYLAELARRQATPVDISHPFAAEDYRLGWLDITLLIAGLRATLNAAEVTDLFSLAAVPNEVPRSGPSQACDTLREYLDERVPVPAAIGRFYVGQQIKEFLKSFANSLVGKVTAQVVSHVLKALSVLYKVQALMLLYEQATARVTMTPTNLHKPVGEAETASATVVAGIPDEKWQAAQKARDQSPLSTAARECARFVGLPVYSDSVTLGQSVKGWQVRWSLERGADHVQIPTRTDDWWVDGAVPGRLQRRLSPVDDHTGNDIFALNVLTEKKADHPGREYTAPVVVCAHIVPGEPPDGFKTILSTGLAGGSLAGGSPVGLAAVLAKLLVNWVATVHTIDACGTLTVGFHIAKPGVWHGTVHVSSSMDETIQTSTHDSYFTTADSHELHAAVTDDFYVGGDDPAPSGLGGLSVLLRTRQYTQGVGYLRERGNAVGHIHSGCGQVRITNGDWGGGWWFNADPQATLRVDSSGSYSIVIVADRVPDEVEWPGSLEEDITQTGTAACTGHVTRETPGPRYSAIITATPSGGLQLNGTIDPNDPPTTLTGSTDVTNDDGTITTHVTWTLTHDGPVRIVPR